MNRTKTTFGNVFVAVALAAIGSLAMTAMARADVKMPGIISDNMCLQQDQPVPIWGWASPGEKVTVSFLGQTQSTQADDKGKWMVHLDPLKASDASSEMKIDANNHLTIKNVLVGQVWLCSGQSNMQFSLREAHNAATVVPAANDPKLRLFTVRDATAATPQDDVRVDAAMGHWVECTPKTAVNFSAVAYFFGRDLRENTQQPVGLIHSSWGGTPAESWTSIQGLQSQPALQNEVVKWQNLDARQKEYEAILAEWKAADDVWHKTTWADYQKALAQWQQDAKAAQAAGKQAPAKPQLTASEPRKPNDPARDPHTPTLLYNAMIHPLMPYAIRGVIWYQGENNTNAPDEYRTLFPTMIEDWRHHWKEAASAAPTTQEAGTTQASSQTTPQSAVGNASQGDFAFLFVQLANFQWRDPQPSDTGWARLREAQLKTLLLPNTGMAVIIDIGQGDNIHPRDKADVGHRLFLAAEHVAYGKNDIVYSGPIFDSMKIEDGKAILSFKQTGSGLMIGAAPSTQEGVPATQPASALRGFAIAGEDHKFVWADAKIDGNQIIVSSPQVPNPVAVRYDWANNPDGNLYNMEKGKQCLPASPFRTDDWPMIAAPAMQPRKVQARRASKAATSPAERH